MRRAQIVFLATTLGLSATAEPGSGTFRLLSPAFVEGGAIPLLYSAVRGGKDISPPLSWVDPPPQAKSFAIVCEDLVKVPFVGFITHWALYDIPADSRSLAEGIPRAEILPDGSIQGRNFYREHGYMGPDPLSGTHRYRFRIYALDLLIGNARILDKRPLEKTIEGHILGQAELTGTFSK